MRWWHLLLALSLLGPASAQAGNVLVRTRLDPADKAVIGQPVDLIVEVLFPGEMQHPPRVSVTDAPGAQVLRFETQALTIREQVGATAYIGQRFTFEVFPRRGGVLAIAAPRVTLLDRGGDPMGSAEGDPQQVKIEIPPGLDPSGPVLAAEDVSLTQSWSPDPKGATFKPGGAIVRVIRRQAQGVPALGMADFGFTAPAGIRVYVDPPESDDHISRGVVEGVRTDRVTYVFEKAGAYDLPPLTQDWWDMRGRDARRLTAAGAHLTVAVASPAKGEVPRDFLKLAIAALALLLVVAGWLWLLPAWHGWRTRRASSEATARHMLRRAAAGGDADQTYRALRAWLGRLTAEEGAQARRSAVLGPAIGQLEAFLFGDRRAWTPEDGAALSQAVAALRIDRPRPGTAAVLPSLNGAPGPS